MKDSTDETRPARINELMDAGEQPLYRLLEGPAATRWSDLNSMLGDIERARDACRRILPLQKADPVDDDLIDMLWHYALLSYGRCFARGVRVVPQTEIVDELDEDARKTHEYYIDVRDKFVAHSVNALEQDMVAVALRDPKNGPAELLSTTSVRVRALPNGRPMVQAMLQQCHRVDRILVRLAKPLGQQLHAWAESMPIEELYALPHVLFKNGADTVGQRRQHAQFRQ